MGGGDLNMKKSWHPLLFKNQQRVWEREKDALEEKKKLDQLRKELEEERQLQELQRMQEAATGKKRSERMDWMYAAPASGSGLNANDMEDYLLGKKRVDKILKGDEEKAVAAQEQQFMAVQNANTARDTSSKIREDPLLAIKQQEQAAYDALLANPIRLRQMREQAGLPPPKDKKAEKEARRAEKERRREEKERRREEKGRRDRDRSRSPARRDRERERYDGRDRRGRDRYADDRDRRRDYDRDRRASPPPRARSPPPARYYDRPPTPPRHSYPSPPRRDGRDAGPPRHSEGPPRRRSYDSPSHSRSPAPVPAPASSAERAARLAAMQSSAQTLNSERALRLAALESAEKAKLAKEAAARAEAGKVGGKGRFLRDEERKVWGGMGLGDQMRRSGRVGGGE